MRLEAQIAGGGHEHGLRSGTLNVPGIVGFAKAVELCLAEMPPEQPRLAGLRNRLFAGLTAATRRCDAQRAGARRWPTTRLAAGRAT